MTREQVAAALKERAARKQVSLPAISLHEDLQLVRDVPEWWTENGNVLLAKPEAARPILTSHGGLPYPRNALIVLGCAAPPREFVLWGEAPMIAIGEHSNFPNSYFCCGGESTIVIGDHTSCTWAGRADARNGGIITVGSEGLWASGVQVNTDDMHSIRDTSGNRLNAFGGTVTIGRHVWLGFEALVLSQSSIGDNTVIGARSVVKGSLPGDSICAGMPARPVKSGTTWTHDDLP